MRTVVAEHEDKLVSVTVEDGDIICKGRSVISIAGKITRGVAEELPLTRWPFTIDGKQWGKQEIINLLQSLYEGELNARNNS